MIPFVVLITLRQYTLFSLCIMPVLTISHLICIILLTVFLKIAQEKFDYTISQWFKLT